MRNDIQVHRIIIRKKLRRIFIYKFLYRLAQLKEIKIVIKVIIIYPNVQ